MRKLRDFDTELKALEDKARLLKERKVKQLGELVIATGADALDIDTLAGALVALMQDANPGKRAAWKTRGEAFFRGGKGETADGLGRDGRRAAQGGGDAAAGGTAEGAA